MRLIIETIEVIGSKKSQKFEALFDTGADTNFISDRISADELGFKKYHQTYISVPTKCNSELGNTYIFNQLKILTAYVSDSEFISLKNIEYDVIIGVDVMQLLWLKLDMSADKILL